MFIVPAKPHVMRANEHMTYDNISETIMHFVQGSHIAMQNTLDLLQMC